MWRIRCLRDACIVCVLVLSVFALVGCSGSEAPGGGDRLSIATGGTGGVYFVYGGALADQITQNVEGVEATAESTSASVDNMFLIGGESSDLAFTLVDAAADAVEGRESFEGEPVFAQALANLYISPVQVVVPAGSDIESIEDLKGRSVSIGAPNSATELLALRIFDAAGIDSDADIERQQLGVEDSVAAVRDGTIDAFFWGGGLPTGAVTDLATTDEIRLLPTAEYLDELNQDYPDVYIETTIPAGVYEGFDEEVASVGARNFLVANESMDEEMVYQTTKVLFEQQEALAEAHPEVENLELQNAQKVAPLELHPGAQRYYDEAGS